MKTVINVVTKEPVKDDEGFVINRDNVLATVKAYKEDRHGNEAWKNRAAFSKATALFRFRKIPNIEITTSMFIVCADGRYNIVSVEDVKNRHIYYEILAEKIEPARG